MPRWCMQIFQFLRVVVATADGTAVMNKARYAACGIPSGHARYPRRCEDLCEATAAAQAPALCRAPSVNVWLARRIRLPCKRSWPTALSIPAPAPLPLIHPYCYDCTGRSWA